MCMRARTTVDPSVERLTFEQARTPQQPHPTIQQHQQLSPTHNNNLVRARTSDTQTTRPGRLDNADKTCTVRKIGKESTYADDWRH
ncbi:hypothetical protein RHGRI_000557 [Rhododendron griersonianum]|uniref:Uncharacterized protein n=1 Tax=Rhododendron griersonianum TaxID=479676 RepID=A0AAV6LH22_9ERIC|nr:hypothetical protein RHGRI_000557 [Rhododendron griersonianum]